MKRLNLLLLLILATTVNSFAQTAKAQTAKQIKENKAKFMYVFTLPKEITKETALKKQNAYVHNFKITFNEETHQITFNLNPEKKVKETGLIMIRYLMALGIKDILVDGNNLTMMDFNKKYIRE